MEQLNRVELRGIVGAVTHNQVSCIKMARFTVVTNLAYKKADGGVAIESQWTSCTAWAGKVIPESTIEALEKGRKVSLTGRLRTQRYTDAEGNEKTLMEVLVGKLTLIDDNESLTMEQ